MRNFLIAAVTIMALDTLDAQNLPRVTLRATAGQQSSKTTDAEGVELGKGRVERSATHMILTDEAGTRSFVYPRGDLATPRVSYSWAKEDGEFVYRYRIQNLRGAPIFSGRLRWASGFSEIEGVKAGGEYTYVVRSPNPPIKQALYLSSLSTAETLKVERPGFATEPSGVPFDRFVIRHIMPHNNASALTVIGPAPRAEDAAEAEDHGEGIAELQ
jgi:hypothetical protein